MLKKSLFILLLVILSLSGCGKNQEEAHEEKEAKEENSNPNAIHLDDIQQKNIDIQLSPAKESSVQETIRLMGKIEPDQTRTAHIRPLTSGKIIEVHVQAGDRVKAGSPLLTYDNIELGDLMGEYREALAEVEVADKALERAKKLVDLGSISRAEFDRREAEQRNGTAKAESIRIKLKRFGVSPDDSSNDVNSRTVLRAPFAGVVIALDAATGESTNTEQELLSVSDLSKVWVTGNVYEKDLARVHVGQQSQVSTGAYPGEVFTGNITYVGDMVNPNTQTIPVRCEVDNRDGRLKLGLFATIEASTTQRHKALTIPASAIQQFGDQFAVFVKTGDNEFEKRVVKIGTNAEGIAEVTSGLRAGDVVVTQGSFQLKSEIEKENIETEEE